MDIIDFGRQYCGKQEVTGPNRGPLVDRWKGEVALGLVATSIPWCACFCFAMLRERNNLTKRQLAAALGFQSDAWYPESTLSWLQQAKVAARLTTTPRRGDVLLLHKTDARGNYVPDQVHHAGFVAAATLPAPGALFDTLEGNTVAGVVGGQVSREGDGVYLRQRHNTPGAWSFISIPDALAGR